VAAELVMIFLLWLFGSQLRRLEASESLLALNNRQLETARLQLDAALSNISQGLCFFGGDRKLILGNRRHNELYHLPREAAVAGTTLEQTIRWYRAGGAPDALGDALLALSETGARADRPTQLVIDMNDGRVIAVALQPMPDGGWVATHEDITERRRVESQIAYLAQHDSLTGLANRALLGEQITRAMQGRTRGIGFALLFLDLDRFKAVNDTYGHGAGDQLLQLVAKRLLHSLREVDSAARLGGDEFVVLQVGLNGPEDAGRLARRIIGLLSLPYPISGHDILIGVSVGIELADNASGDIEVLIKNADSALYTAKQAGRGTYRYFRPADFVEAAPPDDL
jgi:diguanylate cyclase (GGDEF)-like protein